MTTRYAPRRRAVLSARLVTLCVLSAWGRSAAAQQPLPADDGRVRGAPVRPVSYLDMAPGSVQTIALSPRYHTILEFPSPIFRTDMGDKDIGLVEQVGNKVIIKPVQFSGETSFTVMLDDGSLTVVPFLVRPDTAASPLYVVRFTDPVAKHVAQTEVAMARRMEATAMAQLPGRAEALLRQRALLGFEVGYFPVAAQSSQINRFGERVTLEVVKVLYLHTSQDTERAYLVYRVANLTRRQLDSLDVTIRVEPAGRDGRTVKPTDAEALYDVEDSRAGASVPTGTMAEGILVFDRPRQSAGEAFRVTLTTPNGVRVSIKSSPVLGTRPR